ncbi:MAG: phosphatidylserine decarboxylase family protein [Desulfobacterota bacterium]|nr:phosphatidylserine decarboxylase family protein [Thermodesulfobacteriota bacterium]
MIPPIAKEGFPIIGTVFGVALAFGLLSFATGGAAAQVLRTCALLGILAGAFCCYFFRDPERMTVPDSAVLYAPADGTIIDIRQIDEPHYLKGPSMRVSIFMSVFNVHVNRAPCSGTIEFLHYNPGRFISAFKDKASDENESMLAGIKCMDGSERIAVKFIAGLIARRIVFYKKLQDPVRQGERINMIRFGSRVDLFCPPDAHIIVKRGDRVTAGVSVIAKLSGR